MSQVSVRTELAAAIRAVNAGFGRLPRSEQDGIAIVWDELDREVDAACLSDDRERAMAAIQAWKGHWLGVFEEAAR